MASRWILRQVASLQYSANRASETDRRRSIFDGQQLKTRELVRLPWVAALAASAQRAVLSASLLFERSRDRAHRCGGFPPTSVEAKVSQGFHDLSTGQSALDAAS